MLKLLTAAVVLQLSKARPCNALIDLVYSFFKMQSLKSKS